MPTPPFASGSPGISSGLFDLGETLNKSTGPCASDFRRLPASLAEAGSSEPVSARDFAILQNWLAPVSRCFIQRFL
jgi:hypothetical protein